MNEIFTLKEKRALTPPSKLLPSQWAEANRTLPSSVAAEAGRYRNSRTPYMAGIIDAICERTLEEIVIIKAAQLGFTTAIQNLLGWMVCQEPAPALIVMPSEAACKKLVKEQLEPLIDTTPALQSLIADDAYAITNDSLNFDSMPIYLGFAGSPQSLATRACRYVLLDEVDKYPAFSGKDASPIDLARKRTSTFQHRARIVIGSTPTTRDGAISKSYESCQDKRSYHVPCPHCNAYQQLTFSQIIFNQSDVKEIEDKATKADYIQMHCKAYYECSACKGTILDKHKPQMLLKGIWLSQNQRVEDGQIIGERPKAKRVGFQISSLYSPWVSFSQVAAQFVRSDGDYGSMMEFRNQWLGEIFEDIETSFKTDDLRLTIHEAPKAGVVSKWAGILLAGADYHDNRINFVIRAFGNNDRSQLIHYGDVSTFGELQLLLDNEYQIEDSDDTYKTGLVFVDSGYKPDDVYSYAQNDTSRIKAIKGVQEARQTISWSTPNKSLGIQLGILDTTYYKSKLANLRSSGKWLINSGVQENYLRQMASEHKVMDKSGKSVWKKVSSGSQNHWFDCEVYCLAAADFLNTNLLPDETALVSNREQNKIQRNQILRPLPKQKSWLGNTSNWLK